MNRYNVSNRHIAGVYTLAEWNLMGYLSVKNPSNMNFKKLVVELLYHDFYIFPETHCFDNETVEFEKCKVFSNNRVPSRHVKKGSGGIAIGIHCSVLVSYTILSVICGIDGQLAVKLKCNDSDIKVGIAILIATVKMQDWVFTLETDTETFSSLVSSSRLRQRLKFLESRD